MNLIIAQIVKTIVDWIKGFLAAAKLKALKTELKNKQEIANEKAKNVTLKYSDFMHDFLEFEESERRAAALQSDTTGVQESTTKSADNTGRAAKNDRGPESRRRSKRRRDKRARAAGKGRK